MRGKRESAFRVRFGERRGRGANCHSFLENLISLGRPPAQPPTAVPVRYDDEQCAGELDPFLSVHVPLQRLGLQLIENKRPALRESF